jgi:hypothetical protein
MQIERDEFTVLYVQQDEGTGIVHDGKESSGILWEKTDFIGGGETRSGDRPWDFRVVRTECGLVAWGGGQESPPSFGAWC